MIHSNQKSINARPRVLTHALNVFQRMVLVRRRRSNLNKKIIVQPKRTTQSIVQLPHPAHSVLSPYKTTALFHFLSPEPLSHCIEVSLLLIHSTLSIDCIVPISIS